MKKLFGLLGALVNYFCVATVVSAALGYGMLRQSGKLDNETLFQVVALLQGVDLEAIEKEGGQAQSTTPPEEPSFDERLRLFQTTALQFDAKEKQISASLVNFDYQLKQLNSAMAEYARLKAEVEQFLRQQSELVLNEKIKEVREQIASLPPRQAKPLLIKFIQDQQVNEVIMLLGSMKAKERQNILKMFNTEEELDMLYRIQQRMLAGDPTKPFIDEKFKELEQLKAQDK